MGLALSRHDLDRLEAALLSLAAPLEHETPTSWSSAVLAGVQGLFNAPRGMFVLPTNEGVLFSAPGLEEPVLGKFRSYLIRGGPEGNEYADPALDRAMARIVAARLDVWSDEIAARLTGIGPLDFGPLYHDVFVPGRLENQWVAGALTPLGQALLGLFHDRKDDNPFGDDSLELLRLVVPSLRAGVDLLQAYQRHVSGLATVVDALDGALLLCDEKGGELHRNRALRAVLDQAPTSARLVERMRRCAQRMSELRARGRGISIDERLRALEGPDGGRAERGYRVRASYLPAETAGEGAILVVVEPPSPSLPRPSALRRRFGLTPRQAEVALLMARGRSNREMAAELSLSPHTVRHHAQRVLEKMGVRTRKALALRLLEGRKGVQLE